MAGPFDLQVLNPDPGGAASTDVVEQVPGTPPTPLVSPQDASRFLMQATFGGSEADINHLSTIGYNAWFAEQFAVPNTLHEPYTERQIILKVLQENSWNRQKTAKWLQISYRSLLYKLSEVGMPEVPPRPLRIPHLVKKEERTLKPALSSRTRIY